MSNRLPILAAEINRSHDQACKAAQSTLSRAIEAGERLLEAKVLLGHGKWLPWLTENCDVSERTAQAYMRLAKHRDEVKSKSAAVADLTVRAALDSLADLSTSVDIDDDLLPPIGVMRLWRDGSTLVLIEQSSDHPGYFFGAFIDLTEGVGDNGHGYLVGDSRPIRSDVFKEAIRRFNWIGSRFSRPFDDVQKGSLPEIESELDQMRRTA